MTTGFPRAAAAVLALACVIAAACPAHARYLDNRLAVLQPLLGQEWIGHYVDSPDSHLTHTVRWENILDGTAVLKTKSVPDANFVSQTYFYWDDRQQVVAFLTLTNRGQVSRGVVGESLGRVVEHGVSMTKGGATEFRLSVEVLPDGRLRDVFERLVDGSWREGHVIVYGPRGAGDRGR